MDIFGLRINRIRKDDKRDLAVFNLTVVRLNDHIRKMINLLSNDLNLDNLDLPYVLMNGIEILDSLFEEYMSNKFSSPGNVFNIHDQMNRIRSQMLTFTKLLANYMDLKSIAQRRDESFEESEFEEEVNNLMEGFHHSVTFLICSLRSLLQVVMHDIIRLDLGVDIIRQYYDHQRQIKRHNLMNKYEQTYVIKIKKPNKNNKGAMKK